MSAATQGNPPPLHRMSKLLCSARPCNKTPLGVSTCKIAWPTSHLSRTTIQQHALARLPVADCLFHLAPLGCAIPEYACPVGLSWLVSNKNMKCLSVRIAPRRAYWRHSCAHMTASYRCCFFLPRLGWRAVNLQHCCKSCDMAAY